MVSNFPEYVNDKIILAMVFIFIVPRTIERERVKLCYCSEDTINQKENTHHLPLFCLAIVTYERLNLRWLYIVGAECIDS